MVHSVSRDWMRFFLKVAVDPFQIIKRTGRNPKPGTILLDALCECFQWGYFTCQNRQSRREIQNKILGKILVATSVPKLLTMLYLLLRQR